MKKVKFVTSSWVDNLQMATWKAHAGIWIVSYQAGFRKSLHDSGQVASETWNLLPEPFLNMFFSFLDQHYINPHYPQNCKEFLRKKTLAIHLRVRDCKPTIIYTISLSFLLLLPLQLQILKRFLAQTLISPNLSTERNFSACGKYWKKPSIGGWKLKNVLKTQELFRPPN